MKTGLRPSKSRVYCSLRESHYPKQFNYNVSFEFNHQVIHGLTTEKTEKTAESHRDYSVSSAVKGWF